MLNQITYHVLFVVFMLSTNHLFADSFQNEKQIDSLLKARSRDIYDNPDKSIAFGLSVFENTSYSIKTRTRGLMLVSLGHTSKRDYQKALEYIVKANDISNNLNDQVLQIEILFRIGILYQQLKIFDKSIEYMEKTERLSLTYPYQDSVRIHLANSYIVKGFIYKDNLNCDIALEFFDRGLKEYSKIKGSKHRGNLSIIHYNKGNCYTLLSEYEKAKNSFERSIEFARLEKANSLISFARKGLAEVYTLEGEYEKAFSLLETALHQSSKVGDLVLNYGIYKGLFENYLALNQWMDYQKYYDLYLKTQLDIKISERNSISDDITENSKNLKESLNKLHDQFEKKLKWTVLIIIIIIFTVLLLERKNKKIIKTLQKKIKSIQNIKPAQESK